MLTVVDTGFGQVEMVPSREPFTTFNGSAGNDYFFDSPSPATTAPAVPTPAAQKSAVTSVFGSDFDFLSFEGTSTTPAAQQPLQAPIIQPATLSGVSFCFIYFLPFATSR